MKNSDIFYTKLFFVVLISIFATLMIIAVLTLPQFDTAAYKRNDYELVHSREDYQGPCDSDYDSSWPSYEDVVTGGQGYASPTSPFSSSSYPSVWK